MQNEWQTSVVSKTETKVSCHVFKRVDPRNMQLTNISGKDELLEMRTKEHNTLLPEPGSGPASMLSSFTTLSDDSPGIGEFAKVDLQQLCSSSLFKFLRDKNGKALLGDAFKQFL